MARKVFSCKYYSAMLVTVYHTTCKALVPTEQEAGWPHNPAASCFADEKNLSPLPGFQPLDRPAHVSQTFLLTNPFGFEK
jgi:hypothetical protein